MALSPDGQYLASVAPDRASNPSSLIIFQVGAAHMLTCTQCLRYQCMTERDWQPAPCKPLHVSQVPCSSKVGG